MSSRGAAFALLTVVCVVVAIGAVVGAAPEPQDSRAPVATAALARPYVVYRSLEGRPRQSQVGDLFTTSAREPGEQRRKVGRACARVYAVASGGLCVERGDSLLGAYQATVLGPGGGVRHQIPLSGVPSRARISPDGRYGATTMFVTGHSYVSRGAFSTQTLLFDMRGGKTIADLESFTVTSAGEVVEAPDVQFWGITFAPDSDRFYATRASGGRTQLITGTVSGRTARVIRDNVECPSVSPDGRRIAYKKRVVRGGAWRLHVLELAERQETPVAEPESIDDQVEWLNDDHLLYRRGDDIWTVPADGTGTPRLYLRRADSPAVVR